MIDGSPRRPTSRPFTAPSAAPSVSTLASSSGAPSPAFASRPAHTLRTANCEPTEMSICPTRITSVIPVATSSSGALFRARSRRLSALKNEGAVDGDRDQQQAPGGGGRELAPVAPSRSI